MVRWPASPTSWRTGRGGTGSRSRAAISATPTRCATLKPHVTVENFKTSTNFAVDLRLKSTSPAKTMSSTGGAIVSASDAMCPTRAPEAVTWRGAESTLDPSLFEVPEGYQQVEDFSSAFSAAAMAGQPSSSRGPGGFR